MEEDIIQSNNKNGKRHYLVNNKNGRRHYSVNNKNGKRHYLVYHTRWKIPLKKEKIEYEELKVQNAEEIEEARKKGKMNFLTLPSNFMKMT